MTSYRLNDDLSFCHIDGRPIFLDTRNDRYFRLSNTLERAFNAHIERTELPPDDVARLVERSILTAAPPSSKSRHRSIVTASRSALELASPPSSRGIGAVAELFAIVCRTQLQLKTRRLKAILDDTIAYRSKKAGLECRDTEQCLLNDTHTFLEARKFVPVEICCLLDSLSIVMFLARRRQHASIVFGVTGDPFTAHCWAQTGELVLNDAIGNIRAYTVIRVI